MTEKILPEKITFEKEFPKFKRRLRLGIVGGGRISQTQAMAARLTNRWEVVAGAFSSDPKIYSVFESAPLTFLTSRVLNSSSVNSNTLISSANKGLVNTKNEISNLKIFFIYKIKKLLIHYFDKI